MSATFITMENPATGEIRQVKIGLAWDCFFAQPLLLAPFFYRRIYKWAFSVIIFIFGFYCILAGIAYATPMSMKLVTAGRASLTPETLAAIQQMTIVAGLIINVYSLIKCNAMTANNYYKKGFMVINANKDLAALAMVKLQLPAAAFITDEAYDKNKFFSKLAGNR